MDINKDINKDRIRIVDIAEQAGVSPGTVDRVLHDRKGVSKESKAKVEEALRSLHYQPNMYASALAYHRQYKFAFLLPKHQPGDYWTDVVNGMKQAAAAFSDFKVYLEGYYYDQYESGSFITIGEQMMQQKPDAVIMSPSNDDETRHIVSALADMSVPYIFIDSNLSHYKPLAFFGQNAFQSGYFAARIFCMMVEKDAQVVVFRQINDGKLGSSQQANREAGFYTFMKEYRPDVEIHELNLSVKATGDYQSVLDEFFHHNPHIKSGITFNSKAYIIGEYLLEHGMADFQLIGYDLLRRNVQCLRSGAIDFIIAQQPTVQGYDSVECLFESLILKKKVKECNYMPINLISIDNIDFYLDMHLDV